MKKLAYGRATALALLGFSAVAASLAGLSAARAQDYSVQERLDRVERDLNEVQRQLYRADIGSGGGNGGAAPASGPAALVDLSRMDQLQEQMRTLTGQIEQLQNGINENRARIDKLQQDVEQRLQALEHGGGGAGGSFGAAPPAAGAGGQLQAPGDDGGAAPAPAQAPRAAAPAATPDDEYKSAFDKLQNGDYTGAEAAFKGFLKRHPGDPRAGSAAFWVGDTYFMRKDYANAAQLFAQGYTKYPKGPKAPETLLNLGASLGSLGKKSAACTAFSRLDREYPSMNGTLKGREKTYKKQFGC